MTDKLTTAEVRLAATTNLDLPLTQYKKLESGFDAWLENERAEAVSKALATLVERRKEVASANDAKPTLSSTHAKTDADNVTARVRDPKRKRIRPKKNKQIPAVENPTT